MSEKRKDYDREKLISVVKHFREKYDVEVYLEPGEAVVLNAGFLVSTVLETMNNGMDIAILDTSAACHMPDVIEMPYRPPLMNSGEPNEKAFTYRLGGPTCLAGDVIGDYSFDGPLKEGDRVVFEDMATDLELSSTYIVLDKIGKHRIAHIEFQSLGGHFRGPLGGKGIGWMVARKELWSMAQCPGGDLQRVQF